MKRFWVILLFIVENGPNVGFWLGILYVFRNWYLSQSLFIEILFILIPIIIILITIRHDLTKIKTQLLKISADSALVEKKDTSNINRVEQLIKNIPSKRNLIDIYNYALNYAKSWASDGKLSYINFYIDSIGNNISKQAQIIVFSSLRREIVTAYLPNESFEIEEVETTGENSREIPVIYSHSHWKDAVARIFESSASDIEKSNKAKLQLSPSIDSLGMTLYLENNHRKWVRRFKLKNNEILEKETAIFTFE